MFGVRDAVDEVDRLAGSGRRIPRWLLPALAVVILAVAGFFLIRRLTASASPASALQTAVVSRGMINSTVNATGSVVAQTSARLAFKASGRIAEVLVKPGDSVQVGQALVRLDTTDLSIQATQQRAALASAQAKLAGMKAGLRPEEIQSAQAAVDSAQAKLNQVKASAGVADVKAAEQAVVAAQAQLDRAKADLSKLKAGATSQDISNARLAVTQANNTLAADRKQRDYTCGQKANPPVLTQTTINSQCDAAKAKVTYDSTQVTIAQNNLAKLQAPPKTADITAGQKAVDSAQAQVNSAQAKLDQLKAGAKTDDLTIAQAVLTQAQATLALKQNPYTDADLQSAQSAVDQAQAQVDLAVYNIANATLTAPFAGVVSAVNVTAGELSGGTSPAIVLVNPSDIRLDVNVDETDVSNVAAGQKARVAFDALPGKQFDGVVTAVAPNATIQSGVSTYIVSINIANGEGIRPGMTGNAAVIFAEKADALLVPNRAVHRAGKDRYVEVLVGDKQESRPVKIGMTNDQATELVEGVAEGDTVVIATTTSFQFARPTPTASGR